MNIVVNNKEYEVIQIGLWKIFKIKKDGSRGAQLYPGQKVYMEVLRAVKGCE